jgi:hypothetical protein
VVFFAACLARVVLDTLAVERAGVDWDSLAARAAAARHRVHDEAAVDAINWIFCRALSVMLSRIAAMLWTQGVRLAAAVALQGLAFELKGAFH